MTGARIISAHHWVHFLANGYRRGPQREQAGIRKPLREERMFQCKVCIYLLRSSRASTANKLRQPAEAASPPQDPAKLFSQEDLNRILADDRRKHQGALHRAEQTLEDMAASKNLTLQEREQLAQQLEDMRKETQTKEQRLAAERKELESKLTKQLTDEKKDRDTWKNRYCEETTARAADRCGSRQRRLPSRPDRHGAETLQSVDGDHRRKRKRNRPFQSVGRFS